MKEFKVKEDGSFVSAGGEQNESDNLNILDIPFPDILTFPMDEMIAEMQAKEDEEMIRSAMAAARPGVIYGPSPGQEIERGRVSGRWW